MCLPVEVSVYVCVYKYLCMSVEVCVRRSIGVCVRVEVSGVCVRVCSSTLVSVCRCVYAIRLNQIACKSILLMND